MSDEGSTMETAVTVVGAVQVPSVPMPVNMMNELDLVVIVDVVQVHLIALIRQREHRCPQGGTLPGAVRAFDRGLCPPGPRGHGQL